MSLENVPQIVLSSWEYNNAAGVLSLPPGASTRAAGNKQSSAIYRFIKIPSKNDRGWKNAPLDTNNDVYFGNNTSSRLIYPQDRDKFNKVDFTYFRAFLDLRMAGENVDNAILKIGYIDDQARVMIYNSLNKEGYFNEKNDVLYNQKDISIDITDVLVKGEINTIIIVQADDNPTGNELKGGITIQINDKIIQPDIQWIATNKSFIETGEKYVAGNFEEIKAKKFEINAFSINGGAGKNEYFIGLSQNEHIGRIVQKDTQGNTVLEIQKIDLGEGIYAFQVLNYPQAEKDKTYYLDLENDSKNSVVIKKSDTDSAPHSSKFRSLPAFTKAEGAEQFLSFESIAKPGYYLRHESLLLKIDTEDHRELFKQDASWMIHS